MGRKSKKGLLERVFSQITKTLVIFVLCVIGVVVIANTDMSFNVSLKRDGLFKDKEPIAQSVGKVAGQVYKGYKLVKQVF